MSWQGARDQLLGMIGRGEITWEDLAQILLHRLTRTADMELAFQDAQALLGPRQKVFRVFRVSTHTNNFGMYGVWLLARDGETWECWHSYFELPKKGTDLTLTRAGKSWSWAAHGFENPQAKPSCPASIVQEVFG